jgi:iron complex transport system substrate-binding protein
MTAVERRNIYGVNADLLSRAGPRILDGAQELCGVLDDARKKRPK